MKKYLLIIMLLSSSCMPISRNSLDLDVDADAKVNGQVVTSGTVVTTGTTTVNVRHEIVISVEMQNGFKAECKKELPIGYTEIDLEDCTNLKVVEFIQDMLDLLRTSNNDPNLGNGHGHGIH